MKWPTDLTLWSVEYQNGVRVVMTGACLTNCYLNSVARHMVKSYKPIDK